MTVDEFAYGLRTLEKIIEKGGALQTEILAERVAETAKSYLGTYQPGWPPLAASTIASKTTGNSPLLETGLLRDTISVRKQPFPPDEVLVAYGIGSRLPRALWMEGGTKWKDGSIHVPPRPFLLLALSEHEMDITESLDRTIGECIDIAFGIP